MSTVQYRETRASQMALVVKNQTANAGNTETGLVSRWEDLLEKSLRTHSVILASRIPRTEKPGVLQSIASQRIRY